MELQALLEKSASRHSHLCPRQILGVRLGLLGMKTLGFDEPPAKKRLLVIVESDGCFADGVIAATDCAVGHRTLRVEDYGKTAATFIDTLTGRAMRVAPALDVRERAGLHVPDEPRRYFAQLRAYQSMPDAEMFSVTPVSLAVPLEAILSRPGARVNCDACGEEIINERETLRGGLVLCRACAGNAYYAAAEAASLSFALTERRPQFA
ncbi:MAG: TraR/DksA C4-type zinc finger protein [Anaerolineae bacterium]|nr:TraR/DksA C4-type zinc finger protein [Anaerolineae bacterium]